VCSNINEIEARFYQRLITLILIGTPIRGFSQSFRWAAVVVTVFTLNFSGDYIGVLVAPEAAVKLNGSGNSTNEFIGALVANSVKLNGNVNFHFDESLIAAPARLGPPSWSIGNQFLFSVAGAKGFSYVIEASTNLSNWDSLATNTSPFTFEDNSATNFLRRYYRAIRAP
jgi:hypothetical protein